MVEADKSKPPKLSQSVKMDPAEEGGMEKSKLQNEQSIPRKPSRKSFVFGRLLLPGQGGLNPCLCFIFCCSWTCTLQYGCVIAGLFQAVGGVAETFVYIMMLVFYDSPPIFQFPTNFENLTNIEVEDIDDYNIKSYTFLLLSSIIFSIFPGIVLCIAACKIHKSLTLFYCALMGLSIIFGLAIVSYCSYLISDLHFLDGSAGDEVKSRLYFRAWACVFILFAFRSYFLTCAIGFYTQISRGEYVVPPAVPYIRRSTLPGNGNPLMPTPPMVSSRPPSYPGYYQMPTLLSKPIPPPGTSSESPSHE
ncbi:unnamed protein product [Allacma fusca]|uniref:Uncharacterized protein n=2 Tax=Allacma fusca TaxID=39272 RepID=A0A8J2LSF6_9HEXA|nr:unnamed protein product [Allacma fusca]